jgi:hypothetical protein
MRIRANFIIKAKMKKSQSLFNLHLINLFYVGLFFLIPVTVSKAATFTVTNTGNSGAGTLRQAFLDANNIPGLDTVAFNIAPGGSQTITLTSDLPRISDPVIIDGTSQPGFNATPIIELTGPGFSGIAFGITIDAGNSTIRGLVINNFNSGGIGIFTNGSNLIENNFIGTNLSGTAAKANFGQGIRIFNSSNNTIGGVSSNSGNLISGNSSEGIQVNGTNSSNNIFQRNRIGINISGNAAIPNQREGICLCSTNGDFSVNNNLIGGVTQDAGNIIAGNRFDEVRISGFATANSVKGNSIGTNISRTAVIQSTGYGIFLDGGSNNIIGGDTVDSGNIIAGNIFGSSNGGSGIRIERSSGNVIKGNSIGTDLTGTILLPNSEFGISIFENSQNNVFGGISPGEGNLIAFNGRAGIIISNSTTLTLPVARNSIRGNSIFSNGELGIDLATNTGTGVTLNDQCDTDSGNNDLQNFPVLTSAERNNGRVSISGTLNSTANSNFSIDFYLSPTADPTNFGEGKTFWGTINVTTDSSCNASFIGNLPFIRKGQFITATTTDITGNTSEFSQSAIIPRLSPFDFDGDAKTDIGIFRPSVGEWWINRSSNSQTVVAQFGQSTDKIVPADFTGDGKTDIAVWRPSSGEWFVLRSEDSSFYSFPFGTSGDTPIVGDFDADGKADVGVFRSSTLTWYISKSTGGTIITTFGTPGDVPVVADYDGDGKTDIAIYRPSLGQWWIQRSSNQSVYAFQFGTSSDKPVQGDYTGDGKADSAFFRPSTGEWFILRSEDSSFYSVPFGTTGDLPSPGDYDGDGKFDTAVFRPATNTWFINRTTAGILITNFGTTNDRPIPNVFVP